MIAAVAVGPSGMGWLPAVGAALGAAGVVCGALAVFLSGPALLIHTARVLPVVGLGAGAVGALLELVGSSARTGPGGRGGGQGSLFASAGMVLLAFGAARVAERRRLEKRRARMTGKPSGS